MQYSMKAIEDHSASDAAMLELCLVFFSSIRKSTDSRLYSCLQLYELLQISSYAVCEAAEMLKL